MKIYIVPAIMAFLGMLLHLLAVKIPAEQKRFNVANEVFVWKEFFKSELLSIGSTVVTIIMALVALPEIKEHASLWIFKFISYFYAFVGYTGSSILLTIFGKTTPYINKIIDMKTDISDEIIKK